VAAKITLLQTAGMAGSYSEERVLRAKYLDWCSARIAERFLKLSPDEIYQLAERASRGLAETASPLASLSSFQSPESSEPDWRAAVEQAVTTVADDGTEESVSYRALVARVTEVLADELVLPTLEEWSAAYSEAPEEFDSELLGFWREELQ
jgi:hypothetical protein